MFNIKSNENEINSRIRATHIFPHLAFLRMMGASNSHVQVRAIRRTPCTMYYQEKPVYVLHHQA